MSRIVSLGPAPSKPSSKLLLNRRRFLTAVGATALTAPFLRALPTYADDTEKRYLVLLFSSCGVVRNFWGADPAASGTGITMRSWLQPLQSHQDKIIVVRGLANKAAGPGDPHGPGMASLWTGVKTKNQEAATGPSIDQAIADEIKPPTPYPTLAFRAKSPQDYQGKSIYNRMIYSTMAQPVDPFEDPLAARDSLFLGIGGTADAGAQVDPKVELRKRLFARLDGELKRVEPKLCSEDKDQLEALRDGWNKLASSQGSTGMGALSGCAYPSAVTGMTAFPKATRDHIELLVMSLACDLTRIASLQFSQALSPMVPDWLGITGDHHNISHQAPMPFALGPNAPVTSDPENPTKDQVDPATHPAIAQLGQINQFYAGEVAYLCDRLSQFPVGGGKTLLDQCVICWGNELDSGSDHDFWSMPFVLIGGGGGKLKTGGNIVTYPIFNGYQQPTINADRAHNDLLATLANVMGSKMTSFGEPTFNKSLLTEVLA